MHDFASVNKLAGVLNTSVSVVLLANFRSDRLFHLADTKFCRKYLVYASKSSLTIRLLLRRSASLFTLGSFMKVSELKFLGRKVQIPIEFRDI